MPKFFSSKTTVMHGCCTQIVPELDKFDFIFADPPFNWKQNYNDYEDNREDFTDFVGHWIVACWNALGEKGVMALHGPDELAVLYLKYAASFGMNRIDWIDWHYNFNQNTSVKKAKKFGVTRCHCIMFAKGDDWTFNGEDVQVDSLRKSVYKDKRTDENSASFEGGGKKVPGSVWGIESDGPNWGRVQGNNKERRVGHPNQLPEVYLERLIRAYTNKGDRVLDPFAGSGTTAVVCKALERNCITIDISKRSCFSVIRRLCKGAVRVNA